VNRRHFAGITALLLAACGPAGRESAVGPEVDAATVTSEESAAALSPQSLVGEYRVAGIDGEPVAAPVGIAVSIGPEVIELAPCAGLIWNYAYADGMIETRRAPHPEGGILCRITVETQQVGEAMDAATHVGRTPANGLEFGGGGHSVLLFSQ
jgi:hypothetical protein